MDVHLRDLRYFVAVAEELSFSRASERLYVSQPTVSKQVRALEGSLQTTLFERRGRSISLTETGAALLERARPLVADWEAAQRELQQVAFRQEATIVIGIQTALGRGLIARVGQLLSERRPATSLQFRQVGWEDPSAGLNDGVTDAAILWMPLFDPRHLAHEVLFAEARMVLLPSRHRLAANTEVRLGELADEAFLALPGSAGVQREFWLGLDAGPAPRRVGGEVHSADETFEAVAAGTGVVLVSEGNARHYAHDGVVARRVVGLAPAELAIAWLSDDARPLIADLVSVCIVAAKRGT